MPDLAAAVQRLLDRREILDCINRYERALDRHERRRLVMDYRSHVDGRVFAEPDGYTTGTWDRTDLSYRRPLEIPADLRAGGRG